MKLLGYWRSGAAYRVRIALALKGLPFDYEAVNLLKDEQKAGAYLAKNPQGLLPTLILEDGTMLRQSLAIIEYLDETHPKPPLLPAKPVERARARAIAYAIACEAQPFQNLRTQKYLREKSGFNDEAIKAWLAQWVGGAMRAVDAMIAEAGGEFCVGDAPSLADIALVPQVYAALRFNVDISGMDSMMRVYERCSTLDAFKKAHPDNQPDAVGA